MRSILLYVSLSLVLISAFVLWSVYKPRGDGHTAIRYVGHCRSELVGLGDLIMNLSDDIKIRGKPWIEQQGIEHEVESLEFGWKPPIEIRDPKDRPYRILLRGHTLTLWAEGLNSVNDHGTGDDVVVTMELAPHAEMNPRANQ